MTPDDPNRDFALEDARRTADNLSALVEHLNRLKVAYDGEMNSRELSLAITNAEQAWMWLARLIGLKAV